MQSPNFDARQSAFEEDTIDYRALLAKLLRNWYVYVVTVVVALCSAYIYNRLAAPTYKVQSAFYIKDDSKSWGRGGGSELLQGFGLFAGAKNMQNDIVILQSYTMIYRTLKKLNVEISYYGRGFLRGKLELYRNTPFIVYLDTTHLQVTGLSYDIELLDDGTFNLEAKSKKLMRYDYRRNEYIDRVEEFELKGNFKFGEVIETENQKFTIEKNQLSAWTDELLKKTSFSFVVNSVDYLTLLTQAKLGIAPVNKDASIVAITMESQNVKKAIDILNELTKAFLERNLEKKNEIAVSTIHYIDSQIDDIQDSLRFNEMKLQNFRKNKKVMDLSFQAKQVFERIQALQEEEALSLVKLKYYDYLKKSISKVDGVDQLIAPSVMGVADNVLTKLVLELSELTSERRSSFSAGPNSPILKRVDLKIRATIDAIKETTSNAIDNENLTFKNIKERLAVFEDAVNKLPQTQRELVGIERMFELNNQLYTFLLQKRSEAQIARASNTPDNEVIDSARMLGNEPISPKRKITYLIALFLGIILPAAYYLIIDAMSDTVKDKAEMEKLSTVQVVGTIAKNDNTSNTVIIDHPKSPVAESFRALRTSLQFYGHQSDKLTILVTSSLSGEGKTFSAVNLASVYALYGKTVLIGLDLRKPRIFDDFHIDNKIGASTYLSGINTLSEVIQSTTSKNLDVITSGPTPPNPVELIDSPRTQEFIAELKRMYDYVIIDTAPIGLVTDGYLLMKHVDATLFVVRSEYSRKTVIKHVLNEIEQKQVRNFSIVFNGVDSRNYGYAYGYGYYEEESQNTNWFQRLVKR